ncbi:dihydrofolate reductase family protein [Actinoplanes sp. NPDC051346]|uniref:dihydrofolate reductase family protein n=1 Tax=Actinoplanes sp. NPDC051346 TaxID=3155048 RepID=UPI003416022E
MGKIVIFENVTLDGVMQAPAAPEEDTRGGFAHGGWAAPYADEVMGENAAKSMATTQALLFGRRTYEQFSSFWPQQADGNPFTEVLDNTRKYVVSTTLTDPLPWVNSSLLASVDELTDVKQRLDGDLVVLGSGELAQELIRRQLVDRYVLLIHPLTVGSGAKLFREGDPAGALRLTDSLTTGTGVVIATYTTA